MHIGYISHHRSGGVCVLRMLLVFALTLIFLSSLKRNLAASIDTLRIGPVRGVVILILMWYLSLIPEVLAMVTEEGLLILLTLFLNLVLNESILFAWTVSLDRWFQSTIV